MLNTTDRTMMANFAKMVKTENVYPLSIADGTQTGEMYVDDLEKPTAALFWHYCGFANIAGKPDEAFFNSVLRFMHSPTQEHSGRLALQTEKNALLDEIMRRDEQVRIGERYVFELSNADITLPGLHDAELCMIDEGNYDLISGRIVPGFSWKSKEQFLTNGFGVCIMKNGRVLACAFSSAVSEKYVDIGVETAEEARGRGFGKAVAIAMVKESLRRGKTPIWDCDVKNEASKRLALSAGFEISGIHPWYII